MFGLDVIVSLTPKTSRGKVSDLRTTVYKKNVDVTSDLKTK